MVNRDPYPGAQTVSRAVALLKAFTDAQPEWSTSDLARAAGLNKTTTYRLLKALESEGMLAGLRWMNAISDFAGNIMA